MGSSYILWTYGHCLTQKEGQSLVTIFESSAFHLLILIQISVMCMFSSPQGTPRKDNDFMYYFLLIFALLLLHYYRCIKIIVLGI